MMSAQGQAIPDITSLIQVSDDYVRGITHAFNERGSVLIDPNLDPNERSRSPAINQRTRERIYLIAKIVPADGGITGQRTSSCPRWPST